MTKLELDKTLKAHCFLCNKFVPIIELELISNKNWICYECINKIKKEHT